MNLHAPQSYEALAELKYLSKTPHNLISPQNSKPMICIVQDSLTGSYLMTKGINKISREKFFSMCMHGYKKNDKGKDEYGLWDPVKIKNIKKVFRKYGKSQYPYTGHGLVSMILPDDLYYEHKNDVNADEPIVKIERGVIYEGTLDKSILGSNYNSLILILNKEYGSDVATEFIDNIQFIAREWLLYYGFSIGLNDCLITNEKCTLDINDNIQKCYIEAKEIEKNTINPGIREVRITAALGKAKDIGMKIAKDSMSKSNNLLSTVKSGSKGDYFNITQITGLLGQQLLKNKRVRKQMSHNRRTLPHYPFKNLSKEMEYESRGFISHSFLHGLTPQEFYFHAMSAREGICDKVVSQTASCPVNWGKQCYSLVPQCA